MWCKAKWKDTKQHLIRPFYKHWITKIYWSGSYVAGADWTNLSIYQTVGQDGHLTKTAEFVEKNLCCAALTKRTIWKKVSRHASQLLLSTASAKLDLPQVSLLSSQDIQRVEQKEGGKTGGESSFHFPCPHILHLTICAENVERLVASPLRSKIMTKLTFIHFLFQVD